MTFTALVCPHPPLLLRELGGLEDAAVELRDACRAAVRDLLAEGPASVVVVGGDERARSWDPATPVDVRRFGTTGPRTGGLPLALAVGRRLLDEAGWAGPTELLAIGADSTDDEVRAVADRLRVAPGVALLLLGEGSTRRGEHAPGFLDERAFPFDDVVADALDSGEAGELRSLDDDLARELMVSGRAVFRLLGWLGEPSRAEMTYRDDPFGVSYFVAAWDLPG